MPSKQPTEKPSEQTFENSIERLEQIVEQMESDKLPLEDLLVRYEEGVKLVKVCQDTLANAEKRIEIITRGAGGKAQLAPFQADSSPPAAAAKAGREDDEEIALF